MIMMEEMQKRNRPIRTVLKEYLERKKGKVTNARNELHRRFVGLDWDIQKEILISHLNATMSEREWAYSRLMNLWDNCFLPHVQKLWETYHEEHCSWVIIRHFPKTYIMEHLDSFNFNKNYFFICLRFGCEKDFTIDKNKLPPEDVIHVHCFHELNLQNNEAEELLHEIMENAILNCQDIDIKHLESGRIPQLHPTLINKLEQSLLYVKMMGIEPIATFFSQWCDDVAKVMNESPEWEKLKKSSLYGKDFYELSYLIVLKYIDLQLHPPVKMTSFGEHSLIHGLIETLHLELDYDKKFFVRDGINLWDKIE